MIPIRRCTHALALTAAVAVLTSCGAEQHSDQARDRPGREDGLAQRAEKYVGDPWEKRFREQFWADQRVHDSWNRCPRGETGLRPRRTAC